MNLWGQLQEHSFSPGARVTGDLPCQGCGYNLREAMVSGACPECGRRVGESLVPLSEPDKVAAGLRFIGNSYLGLIALPLVPISAAVAATARAAGIRFMGGECISFASSKASKNPPPRSEGV